MRLQNEARPHAPGRLASAPDHHGAASREEEGACIRRAWLRMSRPLCTRAACQEGRLAAWCTWPRPGDEDAWSCSAPLPSQARRLPSLMLIGSGLARLNEATDTSQHAGRAVEIVWPAAFFPPESSPSLHPHQGQLNFLQALWHVCQSARLLQVSRHPPLCRQAWPGRGHAAPAAPSMPNLWLANTACSFTQHAAAGAAAEQGSVQPTPASRTAACHTPSEVLICAPGGPVWHSTDWQRSEKHTGGA